MLVYEVGALIIIVVIIALCVVLLWDHWAIIGIRCLSGLSFQSVSEELLLFSQVLLYKAVLAHLLPNLGVGLKPHVRSRVRRPLEILQHEGPL